MAALIYECNEQLASRSDAVSALAVLFVCMAVAAGWLGFQWRWTSQEVHRLQAALDIGGRGGRGTDQQNIPWQWCTTRRQGLHNQIRLFTQFMLKALLVMLSYIRILLQYASS